MAGLYQTSCLSASTARGNGNSHVRRSTASSAAKLQPKSSSSSSGCRFNVILCGIPEKKSLADEKCSIEEVFNFVAGKSVPWNDAFRIGCMKQPVDSPEGSCEDRYPRPLLVKVSSEWDRRILLSSRNKLKHHVAAKIFLREDLLLDIRTMQSSATKVETIHPAVANLCQSILIIEFLN